MGEWLRKLGEGVAELLFPPVCVACKLPARRHLCDACLAAIPRLPRPLCQCCGVALDPLKVPRESVFHERAYCWRCRELPAAFDCCRAYGPFEGPLRTAIHALKYRGTTAIVPVLAELVAWVLDEEPELRRARLLVPVPLHPARRRERGFNQAELLAAAVAPPRGLELRRDLVAKVRHTRPQVGQNAPQRRENLRDAFAFCGTAPLRCSVLLLDDVVTTGATFHECARVLRAAGATAVYAVALAHG